MLIFTSKKGSCYGVVGAKLEKIVIQVMGDLECLAKESAFSPIGNRRELKASEKGTGVGKVY